MSSKQHLDDHGHIRTRRAPARVFAGVAATPWTPAPRRRNHPVTLLVVWFAAAIALKAVPSLPPMTSFLVGLTGVALAGASALSGWWWSTSRGRATAEAAWVARQSGYRIDADGDGLRWLDADGVVKRATVLRGRPGEWDLVLHHLRAGSTTGL